MPLVAPLLWPTAHASLAESALTAVAPPFETVTRAQALPFQ